jgi:hypothetical protein
MPDTIVYILKQKLVDTAGESYESVLQDLVDQGLIKEFKEAVQLIFEKSKSIHIQSVLEFYDSKDAPITPKSKKDSKE